MANAFLLVTGFWGQCRAQARGTADPTALSMPQGGPLAHQQGACSTPFRERARFLSLGVLTPRLSPDQEQLPARMKDAPCSVPGMGSRDS